MATDLQAVETADDERSIQVKMLPSPDEVAEVVSRLEIGDLREFAIAIMNAAAESARGDGSGPGYHPIAQQLVRVNGSDDSCRGRSGGDSVQKTNSGRLGLGII